MPTAGSRVFLGGCLGEPHAIRNLVSENPDLWRDLILTGAFVPGLNTRNYSTLGRATRVECVLPLKQMLEPNVLVDFLPMHDSDYARRLAQTGFVDCAIFAVAPPRNDSVGLGPNADFVPDAVAIEFGLADLTGLTEYDRAQHLIAIAAPAFRASLSEAWERGSGRGPRPGGPAV